jgi:hypothetical protein
MSFSGLLATEYQSRHGIAPFCEAARRATVVKIVLDILISITEHQHSPINTATQRASVAFAYEGGSSVPDMASPCLFG